MKNLARHPRTKRIAEGIQRFLFIFAAALLAAWSGLQVVGYVAERLGSLRLAVAEREARAAREEASVSGLIGRIEIPELGISALISETCNSRALYAGVGHVVKSAFPGEPGNVVLAAHRDTFFRNLKDVKAGHAIRITTPDGHYAYQVSSAEVVEPNARRVLADSRSPTLTLVTCFPFHYVGPAPMRFIVRASQTEAVPARALAAHQSARR